MKTIAFTDLDDTLFQSPRKCPDDHQYSIAADLPNGQPGAYATPQQQMLTAMLEPYMVIPVTGRRTDSLARVRMTFEHYKVASHGAIILDANNNIHPAWLQILQQEEPQWRLRLQALEQELLTYIEQHNLDLRVRIVEDYSYACYVCVKGRDDHLNRMQKNHQPRLPAEGFTCHINARNLAYMPPYASKKRAVLFLKKLIQAEEQSIVTYLGVGDSNSDAAFMAACDFQILPSHSQIAENLL
ncbi:hypothetical protein [Marinagarivorans algicola]|uniref:hypothetical protein n=1 Tax=Marinagarivorans algicola TaxID=1513270 RepID=UPI0006B526DD|nr:hypothetical protein [Marinagarivorans algicola]